MLSKQELDAALAAERAMYRALSEVQDITRELLDAVDRQDQVSVRLFLSMRQEQINQLRAHPGVSVHCISSLPLKICCHFLYGTNRHPIQIIQFPQL